MNTVKQQHTHSTPSLSSNISTVKGLLALSPAIVFLLLYVAVSLIIGDFYAMPISVALLAASVWSILLYRGQPLKKRIAEFSRAAGHEDILYMIWIFTLAGAFASLAKGIGAIDATVALALQVFPPGFILPGIFIAACFISMSIGTAVGTVVALAPLAVNIAGDNSALYIAAVLGGAFFGDNLSFISDTTIAATRSQGCQMSDKFRANIGIAAPAALLTLGLYIFLGQETPAVAPTMAPDYWLVIPYLLIIALAISGLNVTVVLFAGIVTASIIGLIHTDISLLKQFGLMGEGIDSMSQLIIITLLASGMLGIIKAMGGITFMLDRLTKHLSSTRGARACIAGLISLVTLCTANNTVAIITAGSVSRDIAQRFGISPRTSASILDTCSCIVQCLIPYGAQTLIATKMAGISPSAPWGYLYYPWALTFFVVMTILFKKK